MNEKFEEIQKWIGKKVSLRIIDHAIIPKSQTHPWEGTGILRNCSRTSITLDLKVPLAIPAAFQINVVPPWDGKNYTVLLKDVELDFDSGKNRILLVIDRQQKRKGDATI